MNNKFKYIGILAVILACVTISGCAASNNNSEMDAKENAIEAVGATETGEIEGEIDSNSSDENIIEVDELSSYIGMEELTVENWEDYFEVVEVERKVTDAFGEEVDNGSIYISLSVHAKDFVYATGNDVVMRFLLSYSETEGDYDLETQEYIDFSQCEDKSQTEVLFTYNEIAEKIDRDISTVLSQAEPTEGNIVRRVERNITECKLEKISGKVAILNIPDELWNLDENGKRYLAVKKGENIDRLWQNHCDKSDGTSRVYVGYSFYEVISDYLDNN